MADRIENTTRAGDRAPAQGERRDDWLANGVTGGFVATVAMSVVLAAAFGFAWAVGDRDGAQLERWLWALVHNPVVETSADAVALAIALNLVMGIVWGVVYAGLVEARLAGPGWRRGVLFALGPWLLSVIAFLPIMGGGFLGIDIDAGPLPVLGNLVLHLVYGATLGTVYALDPEAWLEGGEVDRANARAAVRGAAFGIVPGLLVGAVIGWLVGPQFEEIAGRGAVALVGALNGAAVGLLVGSFYGMERGAQQRRYGR